MEQQEYKFICDLWQYMKRHRAYTEQAWKDGDELLLRYTDVKFAPEMMKAYLDSLGD